MNNRRSFFKSLIGIFIAPKVIDTLPLEYPITRSPVYTRTRKLKTHWSVVLEQDLIALHGMDIDLALSTDVSNAMQVEIDNDLINMRN